LGVSEFETAMVGSALFVERVEAILSRGALNKEESMVVSKELNTA
jgi:hypothetical protein